MQDSAGKLRFPARISSSALHLLDEIFRQRSVLAKLHAEGCTALRHRAQVGNVAEHLGKGNTSLDYLQIVASAQVLDHATAGVDVANDTPHVLLWSDHLDVHDRLQDDRAALPCPFTPSCATSDFEGHHRGVNGVETTVNQFALHIDHGETRLDAVQHLGLCALHDTWNILLGDGAGPDAVDKLVTLSGIGFVDHVHLGVLSRTASLLLVCVPELVRLRDCLAVCDLRLAHGSLDVELALHPVHDDLQVQFTHALDDSLVRLFITAKPE
mmetsp:Transcript_20691/g.65234  ORF Transcript_20691/g.65234 Transcript_20691/m.65234 type:complete len:269 (-) Transcript_20691:1726-2532(-)